MHPLQAYAVKMQDKHRIAEKKLQKAVLNEALVLESLKGVPKHMSAPRHIRREGLKTPNTQTHTHTERLTHDFVQTGVCCQDARQAPHR